MSSRLPLLALLVTVLECTPKEQATAGREQSSDPRHRTEAAAAQHIARPRTAHLARLDVGQWTRHRVSSSGGRSDTLTFKVVDRQQQAYWIEIVTGAANAGTVLGLLVQPGLRSKLDDMTLLAARVKMPNGATKELRGRQLQISRSGYLKVLEPLVVPDLQGRPQQSQTVPSGSFEGCYRYQRPLSFGALDDEATVWVHPSVPITGLVKAVDKTHITKVELLDFGLSGAKTSMPRR
jgi:hypothetical protein